MSNRYLERSDLARGKDHGDGFALLKAGGLDGRMLKGRDDLRDFLTKDGADAETVERSVDETKDGEISFPFVLSTSAADRQGDVITQAGWDLGNYRKNPVVLWAHDYEELPVARASAVYIAGDKLKAVDRFSDDHELARTVAALYSKGFLSAVSVGFRPKKWAWNEERGGMAADFHECELLEHSAVPVPAHQDALIEARSAGIAIGPVLKWAESLIEQTAGGLYVPKAALEAAIVGAGTRVVVDFGNRKSLALSAPVEPTVSVETAMSVIARAGFAVVDPAALAKFAAHKNDAPPAPAAAVEPAPAAAAVVEPVPAVEPPAASAVEDEPAAPVVETLSAADAEAIKQLIRDELSGSAKAIADFRQKHTGRLD